VISTGGRVVVFLLGLAAVAAIAQQVDQHRAVELSPREKLALGERMYREGILPSGQPMRALVQGDIEVEGTMFSCASCHLRSGLGSAEGTVVTRPINGAWLAKPLVGVEMAPGSRERLPEWFRRDDMRPAYTDQALAEAIVFGRDPNGRRLHPAMPSYELDEADLAPLVSYLRSLSATPSPGVTETTMHFATVVSEGVAAADRAAMLAVLEAHVRDHNSQVRHEERRKQSGPFMKEDSWGAYRRWSLAVWELAGPPATWRQQLESHYATEPVFALLGGLAAGEWEPIHHFAEEHQIPCLLPLTDFPVISDTDWYTLYFSKGYYQEGEAAARFLHRSAQADSAAVQVVRDSPEGRALAHGFRETCRELGLPEPKSYLLEGSGQTGRDAVARAVSLHPGATLALWAGAEELAALEQVGEAQRPPLVLASVDLLVDPVHEVPEDLRSAVYLTHPNALADEQQRTRVVIERWLKVRNIPVTNYPLQAKMYFLGWTLSGVFKMMRDDFYRDYLLDLTDMMRDQDYAIGVYPRLSFGPGQRYASKGCYVMQVSPGPEPRLEPRSDWIVQ